MNDFNYIDLCQYCGNRFKVYLTEQTPGFRWKEELICPYCGKTVQTSMEFEFVTRKMEE